MTQSNPSTSAQADQETRSRAALDARPFAAGEFCLLIDPKHRRHIVRLDPRNHFHHPRFGRLDHSEIIGKPPGFGLIGPHMGRIVCLRPTLEEYIMRRLKRRTQIIYPKDLGALLISGDIYPGAKVLESGIGSGAAALTLLRYLGPSGTLVSYERREEFAQLALQTIDEFARLHGGVQASHRVEIRDVYDGIDEREVDTLLLDVPEPQRALESAREALRPGGTLLCWLPTAIQVYTLVRQLQDDPAWAEVYTTESLVRPWEVSQNSVRPAQRMVAHTGFLIRARRVIPPVESPKEASESSHAEEQHPESSSDGE